AARAQGGRRHTRPLWPPRRLRRTCRRRPIGTGKPRFGGRVRVFTRIGAKACAEALLTLEQKARAAHKGLWADPTFAPLRTDDYRRFRVERGRFVLVEGQVQSVRVSGATIYVNFGRRFTRDFSVTILRRLRGAF